MHCDSLTTCAIQFNFRPLPWACGKRSLLQDFQRLISVEVWSLLALFNLLKPLVVPLGSLEASVEVPKNTIGFVQVPQCCSDEADACLSADISIDSFPSRDFGVLRGKANRIGSDESGAVFPRAASGTQFSGHNSAG